MKRTPLLIILIAAMLLCNHLSCFRERSISIWFHEDESIQVQHAAGELSTYLNNIYSTSQFKVTSGNVPIKKGIIIGTGSQAGEPGSFTIMGDQDRLFIEGADPAGVYYAVYAFLENEGCEFHLSFEEVPEKTRIFEFKRELYSDRSLSKRRIVFNWHNFLSGCTGWDLDDWKLWISQSTKLRFNGIMVHAYGNNPMFNFSYGGLEKPAGYIANTARGRDWGTEHVNDVRRMIGGEIFQDSIWGAEISKVPEAEVKTETVKLMKEVFENADQHAMEVYFAFDFTTPSANPHELTDRLPQESKLLTTSNMVFANPDTEEGYIYYKSQIRWLLENYPQIDVIAPWVRMGEVTVSGNALSLKKMPQSWRKEYTQLMVSKPDSLDHPFSEGVFFLSKILKAYDKALRELGREDIKLALGTWNWDSFVLFDHFIDPEVMFIPIDWSINFDFPETGPKLQSIDAQRTILPVIWPHHDDYAYIGSPQVPYDKFQERLNSYGAEGFGIIHWTTRPLDLYFSSISKQVWEKTENYDHRRATEKMSLVQFGVQDPMLERYLELWLREGPKFGRETYDYFYDNLSPDWLPDHYKFDKWEECHQELSRAQKRLDIIKNFDASTLSDPGKEWFEYYKGMEEFFILFFESQTALIEAQEAYFAGEEQEAIQITRNFKEKEAIRKYADFIQRGGLNKGEEAILISLNLRWLPDFQNMRQLLGLSPWVINFQATSQEALAQIPGNFTFHFFEDSFEAALSMGEEAGSWTAVNCRPADSTFENELFYSYIESDSLMQIELSPFREILSPFSTPEKRQAFPSGDYLVKCYFPQTETEESCSFKLDIPGMIGPDKNEILIDMAVHIPPQQREFTIHISGGSIKIMLEPLLGKAKISGVEIQRINL